MNKNEQESTDNSELPNPDGNELVDTIAPAAEVSYADTVDPTSAIDQSLPGTLAGAKPTSSDATQGFVFDSDATQYRNKSSSAKKQPVSHVPRMIGGYEIIKVLGHGAMGIVYKAKQLKLDRLVALKMILAGSHASADQLARFILEAKAVGQLQHPNIVQVFDIGEHENLPYFSLEYVDGDSLDKQLARKPIAPIAAAKLLEKLCRAMQYAHEHGILHRDLKPANVLITRDGVPKIADFGLAKRLEDSDDSASTRTGTIMGTPSYMSPEQASGSVHEIAAATDQYSLGAMLYEFITGRPPFLAPKVVDTILQVLHDEPVPPRQLQKNLPADLETICLKTLQKEQDKRYASCAELADDLARFINNEPILARPIGSVERFVRLCRRYPREARLVGIVATLLVLLAGGATATAFRINQDRTNISQQKDQITQQRDEISAEKYLSDQRLTTYRTTVSQLVNRAPSMLQDAPLGSGTREEFLSLIREILDRSEDSGAVGPSRQWGREAISLRQGESLLSQAVADLSQSNQREASALKVQQAEEKFTEAEVIAQEVYDQHPEDKSKAAANLAHALSRKATTASIKDAPLAQIAPLHKRAIELRRESLAVQNESGTTAAVRKAELGVELYRYADFLLTFRSDDPIRFATRAMENAEEAASLLRQAIDELPREDSASQGARQDLGLTLRLLGRAANRRGIEEQAKNAFAECVAVHQHLAADFPNRFSYRKSMVDSANAYGDYLLGKNANPTLATQQYAIAMSDLKRTFDSVEIRSLQNGENGLAMQYYRLGTVSLQSGDRAKAKDFFERSGLLREMAWHDTIDSLKQEDPAKEIDEANFDRCITQRIELMLTKARSGQSSLAMEHAKWLFARAERMVSESGRQGQVGPFFAKDLYLQAGAALAIMAEFMPTNNQPAVIVKALESVKKAIDNGFRDADYLRHDPDLDALQGLEAYQELLAKLSQASEESTSNR